MSEWRPPERDTVEQHFASEHMWLATPRLRLWALPRPALARLHFSLRAFAEEAGLALPPAFLTDETRRSIARKLSRMQDEPEAAHAWHTYWLISAEHGGAYHAAGLVGFKGPPDAIGEAELAYSVAPMFRGQGMATEAAARLIAWAFAHPGCQAIIAPATPRANAASNRVLEKLGMAVYAASATAQSWRLVRSQWQAGSGEETAGGQRTGAGQRTGQLRRR